jgi:hypothetical protein
MDIINTERSPMPDVTSAYTGPERRRTEDRITEARLRALEQQMADIAVTMREAVGAGLRDAVADPQLWEAAGRAMREQAQSAAGGWLLGGVGALGKRAAWVLAIGAGVYALGGWSALVALIKAQAAGH